MIVSASQVERGCTRSATDAAACRVEERPAQQLFGSRAGRVLRTTHAGIIADAPEGYCPIV